ncbi:MAG TPA: prolyl oligopeptidase family serine peptidase [Myxococcaceae bacterium]|nr:prolyl oligopeptidase family serine peptidase [Myxococcaceae bacterium]
MILPVAASLLVLAQAPAANPSRSDTGTAAPRVSSLPVEAAPGLPRVLVSGVPAVPADFDAWLAPYTEVRAAALADAGDDGKAVLILTRFASVNQIHRVSAPLGAREQLTFGKEPVAKARWLPGDSRTVFFLEDVGGGENFQLYRLDTGTGQRQRLTDGKSRHETFTLSRDGRWLAYSGTGRNGVDTDVYLAEVASPSTARRVTEEAGTWGPVEFSPEGERLLVKQNRAIDDADLWMVDLKTRARSRVTPDPATAGKGSVRHAAFSGDGRAVYVVTDRGGEFSQLFRVDAARPEAPWTNLTPDLRWNVEALAVAPDGTLAYAVNEDGFSKLYVQRPAEKKRTPIAVPPGVVGEIRFPNRTSAVLTFAIDTPTSPSDVWQVAVKSGKPVRWTRSEVGGMDSSRFVSPELVRYPSTGGLQIPAFLYRPRGVRPGTRAPVVVYWHGGPEVQERPRFFAQFQAMLDLGLAVLAPNVRGSDGYGKTYLAADDGVKREEALKDIGATLDFIGRQPDLDPSRVAAMGGSYGGYMTLASVAFYPERFRAAVDRVGISSLVTFLNSTAPYRRDLRRAEYGDERDGKVKAVQERISPLLSADKIRAALYVQQGKNDPRVPQSEAEQIVRAVRDHGKLVWYLLALDEGHGFKKKETYDYGTSTSLYFLREQLVGGGAGPSGGR